MNPWAPNASSGEDHSASHAAPYRVSLGGLKAFVSRNGMDEPDRQRGHLVDTTPFSSVQLMEKIDALVRLKATALQRVRELEQAEAEIATGGILLPRQLEARVEAVRALHGGLEELLAMKSVLLRTLQKNVASEYLDLEMQHQRTFIDLFLKLSDELPRYASSSPAVSSGASSGATMTHDVRQRHKEYEAAMAQCKATIAKFHLIHDDMARVRAAYAQLEQSTTNSNGDFAAYAG